MVKLVRSNIRWAALSQVARVFIQVFSVVVFSRLLEPADFGLMAMASVVLNLGLIFRDLGTSSAVIQTKELSGHLLSTVFWSNLSVGLLLSLLVCAFAPIISESFGSKELAKVLLFVSIMFPLASCAAPYLALMERHGEFRSIARIEISAGAAGLAIGVASALLGAGVYSFVFQSIGTAIASLMQLLRASRWHPKVTWKFHEFKTLMSYSGNLVVFNLLVFVVRNLDAALVGRFLGPASLGWYSVSNRLLLFPLQNLTTVIGRALFPVYSRLQDGGAGSIETLYMRSLVGIAAVCAPLMAGLWAIRAPFVDVFLGPNWSPVAEILAWFAPMAFVQSLNSTTGTVLSAIGKTRVLLRIGLLNATLIIIAFVFGVKYGLMGLVIGYFFSTVAGTAVCLYFTLRHVGSSLGVLLAKLFVPICGAILMAGVVAIADRTFEHYLSAVYRVVLLVPVGAFVYTAVISYFMRPFLSELKALLWS